MPEIVSWPIGKVKPYPGNARKHSKDQIEKLAWVIDKFGFDQPIVVDGNGEIIKGHCRLLACKQLGWKNVSVIVREDMTPDQVKAARLTDNYMADLGDWDETLFDLEVDGLDIDLTEIGLIKEIEEDLREFKPTLEPTTATNEVGLKDVEKAEQDLDKLVTNSAKDKGDVQITCPNCATEFYINRDSLKQGPVTE